MYCETLTAQKIKFFIKDFFSECEQFRSKIFSFFVVPHYALLLYQKFV